MFKTRLISGIVLVLIALLTICTGNIVLFMTLLAVYGMPQAKPFEWVMDNGFGYSGRTLYAP